MPSGIPMQVWQETYIRENFKDKTVPEMAKATGLTPVPIYVLCNLNNWEYKKARRKRVIAKIMPGSEMPKSRAYIPDAPKVPIKRPATTYTNIPSPYGIADLLHKK
jgi:hypothetical protein